MKQFLKNDFFLLSLSFFLLISVTIFQSIYQDYTSIIDFDLTVIHNSLQLVSNQSPDFKDHTAYSQFLTIGLFYKLFSFFDHNLISNIDLLVKLENPELALQKLYIASRVANSVIIFITIIFFYKILNIFKIEKIYKILSIIFLVFSETFLANLTILRADIFSICYFFASFFYLLNFVRNEKILNLFLVGFFMVFSLLAKVQIIFLYMFLFFFFVFYFANEKKNIIQKLDHKLMNGLLKYFLILFIFFYFLFQYYLNNIIDSSSTVGYFDLFCFNIYFFIMFFTILLVFKTKKQSKDNLYNIFALILIFFISQIFILKLLDILNIIKIDFNIIFSVTNPFYFLKTYSSFIDERLSVILIQKIFITFFQNFNFNLIYFLILSIVFFISFFRIFFFRKEKILKYDLVYIILFALITIFLITINNFRYNIVYNFYSIPMFLLSIALFQNLYNQKFKFILTPLISFLFVFNFVINLEDYKPYIYKTSNMEHVCKTRHVRDFYYDWASNFDENFFKKICLNKNLLFE